MTLNRPSSSAPAGIRRSAFALARAFFAFAGRRAWTAIGFVLLGAALEGASLALLIPILDLVVNGAGAGLFGGVADRLFDTLGVEGRFGRLALLIGVFVAAMAARGLVLYQRDVELSWLQINFVGAQRIAAFHDLSRASWGRLSELRHARLINLMSADIQRVAAAVQVALQGAVALMILLAQGALALVLAPQLTLAVFGLIAVAAMVIWPTLAGVHRSGAQVTDASLALISDAGSFLGGLKASIAQNTQPQFLARFEDSQAELVARQQAFVRRQARNRLVLTVLAGLVAAAVVLAGFTILAVAPAVLITLVVLYSRMSGPVMTLQQSVQQFLFSLPAFEAITRLRAELQPETRAQGPIDVADGPIVFDRVGYRHLGQGGVHDVSATLPNGAFVGIAGPSGAGKTTFIDLLVGLLSPQSGAISIGDVPLRAQSLQAWRSRVAYVPQDPFLFHASVRENLRGHARLDEDELWRVLGLVGADDLVRGLEHGLDTIVGERGGKLSGGERQRLALAAALLRKPRLLVLDEATNGLDVAAEAEVLNRLADLSPRPTIVIVAHRPDSLRRCDTVLRFDQGALVRS